MTVSAVQVLHGIYWGSTLLSQLSNARISPGIAPLLTHAAGVPQPMFAGNLKTEPMISFDTTQVKSVLDLTGTTIVATTNVDFFTRVADSSGERTAAASTAHFRKRCAKVAMVPRQLSARDGAEATLSADIHILYDGSNEPIVAAGSTALSGTPSSAEHFTVGPLKINGSLIAGVQDLTVDFGIRIHKLTGDGDLYPTFLTVAEFAPSITARVPTDAWSTVGLNGLADDIVCFFRKMTATGRAADNGTVAIGFTVSSSKITIDDTAAGMNDPCYTTIRIQPLSSDGTTAPMVLDTTQDIA